MAKTPKKKAAHPYQDAYDFRFTKTYNCLTKEELTAQWQEWIGWVDSAHPLTMSIYKKMDTLQRKRHGRVRAFIKAGGLRVKSNGLADKRFRGIITRYADMAAVRAKAARKAAGWSGMNYLTSPDGTKTLPNGQKFDKWAMPGMELNDKGAWDGVLKPGMKFTV